MLIGWDAYRRRWNVSLSIRELNTVYKAVSQHDSPYNEEDKAHIIHACDVAENRHSKTGFDKL